MRPCFDRIIGYREAKKIDEDSTYVKFYSVYWIRSFDSLLCWLKDSYLE